MLTFTKHNVQFTAYPDGRILDENGYLAYSCSAIEFRRNGSLDISIVPSWWTFSAREAKKFLGGLVHRHAIEVLAVKDPEEAQFLLAYEDWIKKHQPIKHRYNELAAARFAAQAKAGSPC